MGDAWAGAVDDGVEGVEARVLGREHLHHEGLRRPRAQLRTAREKRLRGVWKIRTSE